MKHIVPTLAAMVALAPFSRALPEDRLPEDTLMLAEIRSVPETRKNIGESSLAEAFAKSGHIEYLKPWLNNISNQGRTRIGFLLEAGSNGILDAMPGPAAFAVLRSKNDPSKAGLPGFLIETGLVEGEIETLIGKAARLSPSATLKSEDIDGVKVHPIVTGLESADSKDDAGIYWTAYRGCFVLCFSREAVREFVETLRTPPVRTLAMTKGFRDAAAEFAGKDGFIHVAGKLPADLVAALAKKKSVDENGAPNRPLGIDPILFAETLRLDATDLIRATLKIEHDATTIESTVTWTEDAGVFSLIKPLRDKPARADLAGANVLTYKSSRFDHVAELKAGESLMIKAWPGYFPKLVAWLEAMKPHGIDIRSAIMENLGDETLSFSTETAKDTEMSAETDTAFLFLYSSPKPEKSSFSFATGRYDFRPDMMTLKDPAKLTALLETFDAATRSAGASAFLTRTRLGTKVYAIRARLPWTMPYCWVPREYSVSGDKLLFSFSEHGTDESLSLVMSPPKEGAVPPDFAEGLKRLPSDRFTVAYDATLGQSVRLTAMAFAKSFDDAAKAAGDDEPVIDPAKAPASVTIPFFSVSSSTAGDHEIRMRTVILKKADAR